MHDYDGWKATLRGCFPKFQNVAEDSLTSLFHTCGNWTSCQRQKLDAQGEAHGSDHKLHKLAMLKAMGYSPCPTTTPTRASLVQAGGITQIGNNAHSNDGKSLSTCTENAVGCTDPSLETPETHECTECVHSMDRTCQKVFDSEDYIDDPGGINRSLCNRALMCGCHAICRCWKNAHCNEQGPPGLENMTLLLNQTYPAAALQESLARTDQHAPTHTLTYTGGQHALLASRSKQSDYTHDANGQLEGVLRKKGEECPACR